MKKKHRSSQLQVENTTKYRRAATSQYVRLTAGVAVLLSGIQLSPWGSLLASTHHDFHRCGKDPCS